MEVVETETGVVEEELLGVGAVTETRAAWMEVGAQLVAQLETQVEAAVEAAKARKEPD